MHFLKTSRYSSEYPSSFIKPILPRWWTRKRSRWWTLQIYLPLLVMLLSSSNHILDTKLLQEIYLHSKRVCHMWVTHIQSWDGTLSSQQHAAIYFVRHLPEDIFLFSLAGNDVKEEEEKRKILCKKVKEQVPEEFKMGKPELPVVLDPQN